MAKSNNNWSEVSGDFNKRAFQALDAVKGAALGKADEALREAMALAEENPNSPLAHHVLGHVRAVLGKFDEALPCLRRAAEIAPNCLEIAFTLALAYTNANQLGPAAEECKRALDVVVHGDPRLHTVSSRRHLAGIESSRIAAAKERLWGLLADVLAAMARERWNAMSDEEQRCFLTVRAEDLQAQYQSQEWLIVLTDATKFVTKTKAWFYLLCPECSRVFLEAKDFQSHVQEEHTRELENLLPDVLKNVADKQAGFLESWISPKPRDIIPPGGEAHPHQGNEIVKKIKDAVLYLDDRKALSVKLVDKLIQFTKGWLGKTAVVPKDLSCIASLDHAGLQVLATYLDRLQISSGEWPDERACGGEDDSPVVIQIQDACVLSVDIDRIVSGRDDGSSNADVLFGWLCLREEPLPSWASMRKDCIAKGNEVLEEMNKMKDLLMKQVNLKSCLGNMNEDYFRREASVDVEIFRIHAEVKYLKIDLMKACRFDYDALILPVMKAHLWHKLSGESPGKGLQRVDEKVDEDGLNNGSPGKGLNGADDTGSNALLNSDPPGNEKDLSEVDGRGGEEKLENTDNLDALHQDDDEVQVLSGDHNVSKSDQQIELPPTAGEQVNLGNADQISMTSQGTSDFGSHMKDQPIIAEKSKAVSPSDCSVSTMGIMAAFPNTDNELQSLNATLRSLWHLRHFSDLYKDRAPLMPHVGVSGDRCLVCLLHELFSVWDDKDDFRPNFVLRYMRTTFRNVLKDANVSQKEKISMAVRTIDIIFTMIHKSQTLNSSSDPGEVIYKTMHTYRCSDNKCIAHSLFGMRKNEEEYTCFVSLDASEQLNIKMKSFSEVVKSVNERFYCGTESFDCDHLPRFFTIVFGQPSDKENNLDVSGLLISIAAPLDISHFYEGLQSKYKYIVLSAVFRAEDRDISFAREQDKWRIYDGSTITDADTWESALDGYNQSRLYPQIIFFERHSSTTD